MVAEKVKHIIAGILAIVALLLYIFGFEICEHFYKEDITQWRNLRDMLIGINMFILVILNLIPLTSFTRGVFVALCFLCFGDLVDRLIFDIQVFVNNDYILIMVAIVAGVITYVRCQKKIS